MKTKKIKILNTLLIASSVGAFISFSNFNNDLLKNNYENNYENNERSSISLTNQVTDFNFFENSGYILVAEDGGNNPNALYTLGNNISGQLGIGVSDDGTENIISNPTKVLFGGQEGTITKVVNDYNSIENSSSYYIMFDSDNNGVSDILYSWGDNSNGKLGAGINPSTGTGEGFEYSSSPSEIFNSEGIVDIVNDDETIFLTVDTNNNGTADALYSWGKNDTGQLGLGIDPLSGTGEGFDYVSTPTLVSGFPTGEIMALYNYDNSIYAMLDIDGDGIAEEVYSWGDNNFGQLGQGTSYQDGYGDGKNFISSPVKINGLSNDILNIEKYEDSTFVFVDTDSSGIADEIYSFGYNYYGELGHGTTFNDGLFDDALFYSTPTKISTLADKETIDIKSFDDSFYALVDLNEDTMADTVYSWGQNSNGILGLGIDPNPTSHDGVGFDYLPTPSMIVSLPTNNISIVDVVEYNTTMFALIDTNDNETADEVYSWGGNYYGGLGQGINPKFTNGGSSTADYIVAPAQITALSGKEIIDFYSFAGSFFVVVDSNSDGHSDKVYSWGYNYYFGGLGQGISFSDGLTPDSDFKSSPEEITGLSGKNIVDFVHARGSMFALVDTDDNNIANEIYSWGGNYSGQLGLGKDFNAGDGEGYDYVAAPKKIDAFSGQEIIKVTGIKNRIYASIDSNNDLIADKLYTWGDGIISPVQVVNSFSSILFEENINVDTKILSSETVKISYDISPYEQSSLTKGGFGIKTVELKLGDEIIKTNEEDSLNGEFRVENLKPETTYENYSIVVTYDGGVLNNDKTLTKEVGSFTLPTKSYKIWWILLLIIIILLIFIILLFIIDKLEKNKIKKLENQLETLSTDNSSDDE